MVKYRKTVWMARSKFGDTYDLKAVEHAVADQNERGPLNVVVSRNEDGFDFCGDAIAAEKSDFTDSESLEALDEALAESLGTIGKMAKDDPTRDDYADDEPIGICYVANHGGLALAFGEAIKDTFRVRKGRVGVAVAVKAAEAQFGQAVAWAAQNAPELLAGASTPEGRAKLMEAFAAAQ